MTLRFFILIVLCSGCASTKVLPPVLPLDQAAQTVDLWHTPFFPQTEYHCGPAALATMLQESGIEVDPGELAHRVYLPQRKGSLQIELIATTRYYGRLPYLIAPDVRTLLAELRAGRPVLVLLNLGWRIRPIWHYAVIVGYDTVTDTIAMRSGIERRKVVSARDFIKAWSRADNWGLAVLSPGQLPVDAEESQYLEAAASLESAGATGAALRSFQAAVERWPESAMAQFGLGNTLYAQGHVRQAESAYRKAIQLNPDMVVARNNLAHVLAERGCLHLAAREIKAATAKYDQSAADTLEQLVQTRNEINAKKAGIEGSFIGCADDRHGGLGG